MPAEPSQRAAVGVYRPYPLTIASASEKALGALLDATGTAVGAPGSATVTLTLLDGDLEFLKVGDILDCDTGASYERVTVTAVSSPASTFTAVFALTHSAGFAVRMSHGTLLGSLAVPQVGTAMVLSLFDGHPARAGTGPEQTPTPASAPALAQQAGGTFAVSAVVNVAITWVTLGGAETAASPTAPITITTLNNEVVVTVPALPIGVTGANVYVCSVSNGATLFRAASNQPAGSVIITAFASSAAAQPPATNQSHLPFYQWVTASGTVPPALLHYVCKRGLYVLYSGSTAGFATVGAKAMIR